MSNNLGFDGGLTCAMQCSNMNKSIDWYQEKLGFEEQYKMEDMGWCELKSPVARVNVGLSQAPGHRYTRPGLSEHNHQLQL